MVCPVCNQELGVCKCGRNFKRDKWTELFEQVKAWRDEAKEAFLNPVVDGGPMAFYLGGKSAMDQVLDKMKELEK